MPKKQPPPEPTKTTKVHYLPFPIRLTKTQINRLDEIAKANGTNRSDLAREAIQFYIENYELDQDNLRQSKLERRITQLDERLRALLIRSIRLGAQNLYFSCLPYIKGGLPKHPLSQENFNKHFTISRQFAGQFLKAKGTLSSEDFEIDEKSDDKPIEPAKTP